MGVRKTGRTAMLGRTGPPRVGAAVGGLPERRAGGPSGPARGREGIGRDRVSISGAATGRLSRAGGRAQTFEAKVRFGTARDGVGTGNSKGLERTLDRFVAAYKKLSPAERKALPRDPGFKISVTGHASNLGNATDYDNRALSLRRARNTADFAIKYLKRRGVEVDRKQVSTAAMGTPGSRKKIQNNDQEDRAATLEIVMPVQQREPRKSAPKPQKKPAPPRFVAPPARYTPGPQQPPAPAPAPVILPPADPEPHQEQEEEPAPLPEIPMGGWQPPQSDNGYRPPAEVSLGLGPGYVRPGNWFIDR